MTVTKTLRNHILNIVAVAALERICHHVKEADGDMPPELWDPEARARFDLLTDMQTAISNKLMAEMNALCYKPAGRSQKHRPEEWNG